MSRTVLSVLLAIAPLFALGVGNPQQAATPPAQDLQAKAETPNQAANPPQTGAAAPQKAGNPDPAAGPADPLKMADPKPSGGMTVAGAAPVGKAYVIGPEDILGIMVYGQKDFSTPSYLVRPDGMISVPLIGEIAASGRTPELLGSDIADQLKKYIRNPEVIVTVLAVHSRKFRIQGEVNKPGEVDLVRPTTVMEALSNAGGFREFADLKHIKIFRNGGKKILNFNYKDVSKGKKLEQNVYIEPNDIIIVN